MNNKPIAWLAHPLAGDVQDNLAKAKRWLRWAIRTFTEIDFAADWILWCEVLDDSDPKERARGIAFDDAMIKRLNHFWMVGGRISNGMAEELKAAERYGIPVVDLTKLGSEPPITLSRAEKSIISGALINAGLYDEAASSSL